jgi:hypothetical protein
VAGGLLFASSKDDEEDATVNSRLWVLVNSGGHIAGESSFWFVKVGPTTAKRGDGGIAYSWTLDGRCVSR